MMHMGLPIDATVVENLPMEEFCIYHNEAVSGVENGVEKRFYSDFFYKDSN